MKYKVKLFVIATLIALLGYLFQIRLQSMMRPYARDGLYFQQWSSESMMQTVSLEDLRTSPVETLWNIHIQPPALDVIRTILVHVWPSSDPLTSVKHVDLLLYQLWSFLYGLLGSLIFLWVSQLSEMKVAFIAAIALLLHPACIFYATFLDTTLMSTLLISYVYYQLWKVKNHHDVSTATISIVVLALLFTRSIFQWPFILLFTASLYLVGMSKRETMTFLLITVGIFGLYLGKQQYKFGLSVSSSFAGLNLTRSVGISDEMQHYYGYLDGLSDERTLDNLPSVLTRKRKITGATNFNHVRYLELNRLLIHEFVEYVLTVPKGLLAKSYLQNFKIYFQPSSEYGIHAIVDRIPWRSFYDRIFSSPVLYIFIILVGITALISAVTQNEVAKSIGMVLPGLYVFIVSVLFEKGGNMRFKFFIEPVFFVLLIAQFHAVGQRVWNKVKIRYRGGLDRSTSC
ncbi:MAG: hypothetical protein GTO14_19670 [Anaerolineales bacterium]|nr:hypothetical protein [Anaerolineales bacterium]